MIRQAFIRRGLLIAATLLAATAALGFAQASSTTNPGHPSQPGVLVISVESGSPAETAGIVRGDIITDIGGTAVNNPSDIRQAVGQRKQGETLQVKLRHGDAEKTLSVALGEKNGRAYMGVLLLPEGRERTGMLGPQGRVPPWAFSDGAFVARVVSGSPADKAGIKRGDVILSVDGTTIDGDHSLSAMVQEKKPGDTVTLSVRALRQTADNARDVKVTLGTSPDAKKPWLGVEYRQGLPMAFLPWDGFPHRGATAPTL
ncbi:MAG: PDZ domain-containing protein [Spirochaetia bacterium]